MRTSWRTVPCSNHPPGFLLLSTRTQPSCLQTLILQMDWTGHKGMATGPAMDDNRVLVAIMNNPRDFAIARDRHWYRISVRSAEKWARPWPPRWLAFYQTKDFGPEACAVHYYCRVFDIREVSRAELFPDNEHDEKAA